MISEEIYLTTVDQVLGFKVVSKFEPPRPSGQRLLKVLAAKSMAEHFGQHSCTAQACRRGNSKHMSLMNRLQSQQAVTG